MCYHADLISRSWWYRDLIPTNDIIMIYYDITPNSSLDLHVPDPTWYHMISHDITSPDHSPSPHNTNFDITIYHVISWIMIHHDIWHDTRIRKHRYEHKISMIWRWSSMDMEMIFDDMEMAWQPHGSLASSQHPLRQAWDISRISSYFFGGWRERFAGGAAPSVRSLSAIIGRGFVCGLLQSMQWLHSSLSSSCFFKISEQYLM